MSLSLTPPYSVFQGRPPGRQSVVGVSQVDVRCLVVHAHRGQAGAEHPGPLWFPWYVHADRDIGPFERFKMGGAGLGYDGGGNFMVGTDYIGLRGYDDPNATYAIPTAQVAARAGGIAYNKYVLEMRYPVSLEPGGDGVRAGLRRSRQLRSIPTISTTLTSCTARRAWGPAFSCRHSAC
ncbi:MAG: hypothetical protein WKG07_33380 [Hymenobacter sp.]